MTPQSVSDRIISHSKVLKYNNLWNYEIVYSEQQLERVTPKGLLADFLASLEAKGIIIETINVRNLYRKNSIHIRG
jgi:hypothetical protein